MLKSDKIKRERLIMSHRSKVDVKKRGGEHARRPYSPPRLISHQAFERQSLGCDGPPNTAPPPFPGFPGCGMTS